MYRRLIGKLKALRQYIVRRSYSLWYGVKFESGYKYQMIKHTNLDLLERHHYLMLDMGWERFTDVDAGFSSAWCWYRTKSQLRLMIL
jgi:hypothetical protein